MAKDPRFPERNLTACEELAKAEAADAKLVGAALIEVLSLTQMLDERQAKLEQDHRRIGYGA